VAGTYGRAMWVLDDLTPLRQMNAQVSSADMWLFKPETAIRVRNHDGYDTPLTPENPMGTNPPEGAILNYYLKSAADKVTLSIFDGAGRLVRELTSVPPPPEPEPQLNVPNYWLAHPQPLPSAAGMNRVAWDLRYTTPPAFSHSYPISAFYGNTPAEPRGPLVAPGDYEARLTVAGKTLRQPLRVTMDPRVKATAQELTEQRDLGVKISEGMFASDAANQQVAALRAALGGLQTALGQDAAAKPAADAASALATKAAAFGGAPAGRGGRGGGGAGFGGRGGGGGATVNFMTLNGQLGSLMNNVEQADAAPSQGMHETFVDSCEQLGKALSQWDELKSKDLAALNALLGARKLAALPATPSAPACGK